jgi:hypothetical protein
MNSVRGLIAFYVVCAVLCRCLVLQSHLFVMILTVRISVKVHQINKFQMFHVESHI